MKIGNMRGNMRGNGMNFIRKNFDIDLGRNLESRYNREPQKETLNELYSWNGSGSALE